MSKSIKLSFEPTFEFILIGFVTSEPLYRVSWLINERLDIQLKESTPVKEYNAQRQWVQEFAMFQFTNDDGALFQFFQNKGMQGNLIEEQKQVDFWLKIENSNFNTNELLQKLKGLKNVSLAFEVKPGSLKSKMRLLFSVNDD